jgi:peptidoglycan/LPS O-acetylase OafA/YrhL
MDLLRGLLMLLGVVLHTLAIFSIESNWKISSPEKVSYAGFIIDIIHFFRMPAFFIISGFFTALILERRNRLIYIKLRLSRLGIPLLFIGLMINIPVSIFLNDSPVDIGWMQYLGRGLWLGHLWFLSVLIFYSVIVAIFWPFISAVLKKNNNFINLLVVVVTILSYPVLIRIGWVLSLHDIYLFLLATENLFQYLPYFVVGLVYYFQSKNSDFLHKTKSIILVTFVSVLLLFFSYDSIFNDFLVYISSSMVSFSVFSIMSKLMRNKHSSFVEKLADSSYTIYVLHQPIIILLGLYFIDIEINVHLKILLILIITTMFSIFVHRFFVTRFNIIGLLLNGNSKLV